MEENLNYLTHEINNDIDNGYINSPYVKYYSLTNNYIINYYKTNYIRKNYIKNSSWYSLIIDIFKVPIENYRKKIVLNYQSLQDIMKKNILLGKDENGATYNDVVNFFMYFKIALRTFDVNMNLIPEMCYEPEKRNTHINPEILYVVFHNKHIYHLNHNLESLCKKISKVNNLTQITIYKTVEEYLEYLNNIKEINQEKENKKIEKENKKLEHTILQKKELNNSNLKCLKCNSILTIDTTPISLYGRGYKYICKNCNTLPVWVGIIPYFKVNTINELENNGIIPILNNYITENIHNSIEYCNLAKSKSEHRYMIEKFLNIVIQINCFKYENNNKITNNLLKLCSFLNYNYEDNIIFDYKNVRSICDYINKITYDTYTTDIKNFLIKIIMNIK